MTDLSGGPILFLNPDVVLPRLVPAVGPDGFTITGTRNAPPQTNGSIDRLNGICRTVGAAVVLTRLDGGGDVRTRLERLGLRAAMPADWYTDPLQPDPAASIPAWLAAHGNPPYAVVDRPLAGPQAAIRINVLPGSEITAGDAAAVTIALQALA